MNILTKIAKDASYSFLYVMYAACEGGLKVLLYITINF